VRFERAPFDHPEILVPNGHEGDHLGVTAGNVLHPNLALDQTLVIPAVGASGSSQALTSFDAGLSP
jgi:hypothetical protein